MARKVIGIVASKRKMGNCEVLTKAALVSAREFGAEVCLVRLTDLRIEFCDGCMSCAFDPRRQTKSWTCALADDMGWLIDEILGSDGLIVSSPTYALGPSAIIKAAIDRTMGLGIVHLRHLVKCDDSGGNRAEYWSMKPAATIATAGPRGWSPFSLPVLNQFVMALGFRPVGSMVAFAPGPGQILLDESAMNRARQMGRAVALNERIVAPEGHCPVCMSEFFRITSPGSLECVVCGLKGEINGGREKPLVAFDEAEIPYNRWTPRRMLEHRENWILKTREMYMRDRVAIRAARKDYEDSVINIRWVKERES